MYETILVTLDGTPTDRAIIEHIKQLAKLAHSRLVLLHVADGWAARTYGPDAVSPEIAEDTAYLEKVRAEFQSIGIPAQAELAYGEPADEIIKWVQQKGCDLVAMSTHGHRSLPMCFSAPPPAGCSTASAPRFCCSGQNKTFDDKSMTVSRSGDSKAPNSSSSGRFDSTLFVLACQPPRAKT